MQHSYLQVAAVEKARKKDPAQKEDGFSPEDALLQANLLRVLGPQKKKIEEVDLAEAMKATGLSRLFHIDQWPDSGAVRELATQMKKQKFVACDLHKFFPSFCPEGVRVVVDDESKTGIDIVPNVGPKGRPVKRMDLVLWQMAWDRFALAAAMLKMVPFSASMQHKGVVLEIAVSAAAEDRLPVLAVIYDELVRKEWENKSGLLGEAFKIADRMAVEDETLLKRAKR